MQIHAAESGASGLLHFSHRSFISNAIANLSSPCDSLSYRGLNRHGFVFMHTGNSIIIRSARETIFETAADLSLWPKILPHYRYVHYLEQSVNRNVVIMAATRSGIPISWTSEQIIDRERFEIHFHHLKAWTKGMHVVWTFETVPDGVLVEILHDLNFRIRALAPIAEPIIGNFFISNVANKTLHCMKAYLESQGKMVAAE
jgi:ribosome-associated toxin RatA of RatAB toxin-antitoxin module